LSEQAGIMLALLAAGQSRRFGDQDKLTALLGDKMLGLHAAGTGADMPFVGKIVIGSPEHCCAAQWSDLGYQIIANEDAALGQASSVRLAAAQAIETGASALCIMLADMPFVTREHIDKLIAAFAQSGDTVASARGEQAMPPAIFPYSIFQSLTALEGDSGAHGLLADAHLVASDDPVLMDIDSAEDLAQANIIYNQIR
jgi:CTP:molybdopterin cytidylyltransferase MocA